MMITLIITRVYGADAFGNYALFIVAIQFSAMIATFGLDQYLLRDISKAFKLGNENEIGDKSSFSFLFSTYLAIITLSLFYVVNQYVALITDFSFAILLIGGISLVWMRLGGELIRAFEKPFTYSILSYIAVHLFLGLFILLNQLNIIGRDIVEYYAYSVAIVAIFIFFFHIKHVWKNKITFQINQFEWLQKAFPFFLVSSISFVNEWVDKVCLKLFTTSYEVGLYTVDYRLAQLVAFPLMALNIMLAPAVANQLKNKISMQNLISNTTKKSVVWGFSILIILVFFGEFLLALFGQEFVSSYPIMIILCVAQIINVIIGPIGVIMKMTNGEKALQHILIISTILNIILNCLLIPEYETFGAATSTLISIAVTNLLGAIWIKKQLNVQSWLKI